MKSNRESPHPDASLRHHLLELLRGGHAHMTLAQAVDTFPMERVGVRPDGLPHSAWELLEHIRITQNDILRFSQSGQYESPAWPEGYWPSTPGPEKESEWDESLKLYRKDLADFETMVTDTGRDPYAPFPWGTGQTLLREAMMLADHTAYHVGQMVLVRKLVDG